MKSFATLALLGAAIAPAFATILPRQSKGKLPPVEVKGNAFFANNKRFYVRGVAYQPGKDDIASLKSSVAENNRWCRRR
jgi:hypothetical protein